MSNTSTKIDRALCLSLASMVYVGGLIKRITEKIIFVYAMYVFSSPTVCAVPNPATTILTIKSKAHPKWNSRDVATNCRLYKKHFC
jgi:uncharacterized membrane protein